MSTCRRDYYAECKRWLAKADVQIYIDRPIFIHPLYSYAGEVQITTFISKFFSES